MHVLQMISKNDRYGAQRIFLDQVAVLQSSGNTVSVVGCASDGFVSDSVREMGIPYQGISWRKIRDIFGLKTFINKSRVDILHSTLDRADYYSILLSLLTGRPMVSTMMTLRCHHGYRIMKHIVVLTNKQKLLLERKGIRSSRITVVRPGIDVQRFANPQSTQVDYWRTLLNPERYSIIFCHVANLLPRKAHVVSLELVAACKKRGETPLLVIIGDPLEGEYYEALVRRIADLGIKEHVHFTGWIPDVPEILSLSHFSLLPSEQEALGVVLMEGMAAGTPIIAREGEGGAELIEEYDAGFLFQPAAGVKVLADRLLALRHDPVRYSMLSDHCRRIAREEFNLSRFGEKLMTLYVECVVKKQPQTGEA